MLFHDDVVTDGQTKAGALPRRLRRKKRVEHLILDLRRDPDPIIAKPYLHPIAEVLCRGQKCRLEIDFSIFFGLALGRSIKAV